MKGMPTMPIPTPEQENKNSNGENTEDNTQAGGSSEESKQEVEAAEKAKQEAKLKKAEDELRESIPTYSVNPINSHLSTSQPFNPSHGQIVTNPDTDMQKYCKNEQVCSNPVYGNLKAERVCRIVPV